MQVCVCLITSAHCSKWMNGECWFTSGKSEKERWRKRRAELYLMAIITLFSAESRIMQVLRDAIEKL